MQTAIGVKHPQIRQKSQGMIGASFNSREFFHGKSREKLKAIKWFFLLCVFALPLILISLGLGSAAGSLLLTAFIVQYLGLLAERWFFFAQANHPQNLYYSASV